jgi:hypothetical protein
MLATRHLSKLPAYIESFTGVSIESGGNYETQRENASNSTQRTRNETLVVEGGVDPILVYTAGGEVNHLQWSASHSDWVAIAFASASASHLQVLHV